MTHRLLTPMSFRNGRTAPNRLWVAPMTNKASHDDGTLSDDEYGFMVARAAGGFGVVESCASHVTPEGQAWTGELAMYGDQHAPGWRRMAGGIQAHGSLLIGQAFHGGMRALREDGRPTPWSCSPQPEGEPQTRAATEDDIERTIAAFAAAAARLEAAGADGVELHGAHGYLLCQFLSSVWNQRTDDWGGSLEHRARFIRRTMQACRAAVSDEFIVGVRLSPESSPSLPGIDLDESLQVASWLCEDGADFMHISLWDAEKYTTKRPDQHAARLFRDALPDAVPVITAGAIWTVADAEAQLDHGADAVALGRAAICNPDWPRRVVERGEDPTRPPVTGEQLRERALGPVFVDYMRRWDGFVSD
jgi:2,4-dienoyl-CoA reductase-like NADH-dependent reductase (Old Yellow Enzyme family)